MTKKETFVDKGLDMLLVVISILMALSIDSCREDYRAHGQWELYSKQFVEEANLSEENNKRIIERFTKIGEITQKALDQFKEDRLTKEMFSEVLSEVNYYDAYYPDRILYDALIRSGNRFFLSNTELVKVSAEFFNFKLVVDSKIDIYSNHVVPDVKAMIADFYDKPEKTLTDKSKIRFFLILVHNIYKSTLDSYVRHEKIRKAFLETLTKNP